MNKCNCCGADTKNPKYCSRSCAAKISNVTSPKRAHNKKCIKCGDKRVRANGRFCQKHLNEYHQSQDIKLKTIGEYRRMKSVSGKHPSWLHSHIRILNRSWNKKLTSLPCASCGYSKHVELAHIKPLSSFDDSELLIDVNSPDNVIQLCRNCHWEMDNDESFDITEKVALSS